ncbi:MAG: sensor histidine kinase [Planctomycetota bacterium]
MGSIAIEVFDRLAEDPDGAELLARDIMVREIESEPEIKAQALLAFGWCRLCKNASADASAFAFEALAMLEGSSDRHTKARAYQLLAGAHHAEGDHGAGVQAARRAAALHDAPPMTGQEHEKKVKAVARIGGGIAHDFKNMLTAIVGYADLAHEQVPAGSRAASAIESILRATGHARKLIREILLFSRRVERKLELTRVQLVVREAIEMIQPRLRDRIQLREAIDAAAGPVRADASQLHRVAVNLMTNACDALAENGGVLTVAIEEVDVDGDLVAALPNLEPGRHVVLRIADNGTGMSPDVQRRIFEPYFTTRKKRQGHGLGLSVVQSLVIGHGGDLTVESYPGIGSTFSIYLRRATGG